MCTQKRIDGVREKATPLLAPLQYSRNNIYFKWIKENYIAPRRFYAPEKKNTFYCVCLVFFFSLSLYFWLHTPHFFLLHFDYACTRLYGRHGNIPTLSVSIVLLARNVNKSCWAGVSGPPTEFFFLRFEVKSGFVLCVQGWAGDCCMELFAVKACFVMQ